MTRGAPAKLSSLRVPVRGVRGARVITCPTCQQDVATRGGEIAGHYRAGAEDGGRTICPASSMPVPSDLRVAGETPTRGPS